MRSSSYGKLTPEYFDNEDVIRLLHDCGDVKFKNTNDTEQIEIISALIRAKIIVIIFLHKHGAPLS